MIKVGIYIDVRHKNVDCTSIERGNPGLGGTQYQMLLLAYHLANTYKGKFEVYLFVDEKVKFANDSITQVQLPCKNSLREEIKQSGVRVLIVRSELDTLKCLEKLPIKIISWSHNFLRCELARQIAEQENVEVNVFVGKQQYDRYIDDDIIKKSTFIFNMVPSAEMLPQREIKKNVVFIGALISAKGFHILASIWKRILKDVPDAQLYVLGSAKLYGVSIGKMGRYGVAEKEYEDSFIRYLCDEGGNLLPSVHFEGIVGGSKVEYFNNAAVGVINPSAKTETFGLGIVEMNTCGVPIVTANKNGFPDVVKNGETGFLCRSKSGLAKKIISLLKDRELNIRFGNNAYFYSKTFAPEVILPQWISLINSVCNNRVTINYIRPNRPYIYNLKWLVLIIRFIRYKMKISCFPSTLRLESIVRRLLRRE